jgi:SAM-dependent methyltransferase
MSNIDTSSEAQMYWNEEGGDKWVENIDFAESFMTPMSDRLIERIAAKKGEKILDVGCGGGITTLKLAALAGEDGGVLGVDVSRQIIDVAIKRAEDSTNIEFQHSDAASTEFGENKFDLITSRFGVMFFDDPVAAFKNLHLSLKPTGRLVFLCWRTPQENPWMAEPAAATFQILPPPMEKPAPTDPGPFSLGEAEHLTNVLQLAGFTNINLEPVDLSLPMSSVDTAVGFLTRLGPAADALKEASDDQRVEVIAAIRSVMEKYSNVDGVLAPAATWIASASK